MEKRSSGSTKKRTTKREAVAKRPKAKSDELVVFAFRLTETERTKIHKMAGPAKASRYVRRVAAAFANADESAFRAVLKEAREAR